MDAECTCGTQHLALTISSEYETTRTGKLEQIFVARCNGILSIMLEHPKKCTI